MHGSLFMEREEGKKDKKDGGGSQGCFRLVRGVGLFFIKEIGGSSFVGSARCLNYLTVFYVEGITSKNTEEGY